jgi:hypothetical protein
MNKRMAAIIKMLSSKHEAEVVSAARALGAELTRNGKDWNDLGSYLASWDGMERAEPAPPPERPRTQTYSGSGPSAGASWTRRARDPAPVDIAEVNQRAEALANYLRVMSRQDQNFIESILDRFDMYQERALISPAQRDWVYNLYDKLVENKGRYRR